MFVFYRGSFTRILIVTFFSAIFTVSSCVPNIYSEKDQSEKISLHGDVNTPLMISMRDLKEFPSFHISNVSVLKEKSGENKQEERIGVFNYKGTLLRDILEKAEMKYKRKWEPLVFFRVRGTKGKEVVFSFGELFYSSIGRSILIAYEKDGNPINFSEGCGELIITTDVRSDRWIQEVKEIVVERVNIEMHAYNDKKNKIIRPPTDHFILVDQRRSKSLSVTQKDLESLPSVFIPAVVMTGDCEGFHGVFSFEGPSLRSVLEKFGFVSSKNCYDRYVVISSEDGFSAAFSFGEIFNSRLSNNIIIAIKKDGRLLGPKDGFAMSIVGEDSTGGRSVKRIQRVEIIIVDSRFLHHQVPHEPFTSLGPADSFSLSSTGQGLRIGRKSGPF